MSILIHEKPTALCVIEGGRAGQAHHEGGAHVADACHGLHGELAEQRQHEVLQQAVLEHPHRRRHLPALQRPAAEAVVHRRPHLLQATADRSRKLIKARALLFA